MTTPNSDGQAAVAVIGAGIMGSAMALNLVAAGYLGRKSGRGFFSYEQQA